MVFRLLRICSSEASFELRQKELKESFLLPRGYKGKIIDEAFRKIDELPGQTFTERRQEALKKKEKEDKNKDRIVVPIDFNPHMAKPSQVLNKHYRAMVRKKEELLEVFPANPMAGLRQPKNIRRILVVQNCTLLKEVTGFSEAPTLTLQAGNGVGNPAQSAHIPWMTVVR